MTRNALHLPLYSCVCFRGWEESLRGTFPGTYCQLILAYISSWQLLPRDLVAGNMAQSTKEAVQKLPKDFQAGTCFSAAGSGILADSHGFLLPWVILHLFWLSPHSSQIYCKYLISYPKSLKCFPEQTVITKYLVLEYGQETVTENLESKIDCVADTFTVQLLSMCPPHISYPSFN